MKTVFFSTSDRMLPVLRELPKLTDLKLCITKTDVKVGRNRETKENEVKLWCLENNIDYIQIDNLKGENLIKVLSKITNINPDLGIVVDFGFMIPNTLIETFKGHLVNIHYSLLPKHRGASPIQFAILNNDRETGVTYQLLEKEMDKGKVLFQQEIHLTGKETYVELFEQLLKLNIESMSTFIELWKTNKLNNTIQDEATASHTYSPTQPTSTLVYKEDAYTTFIESPEVLERKVRAFNPRPILWSHLKYVADYMALKLKDIAKEDLTVKIYDGKITGNRFEITTIQVEGKNKTDWESFKNGYLTN
jgi:methionyl-tRNA formyltransferase